jgi:hypothetical protein
MMPTGLLRPGHGVLPVRVGFEAAQGAVTRLSGSWGPNVAGLERCRRMALSSRFPQRADQAAARGLGQRPPLCLVGGGTGRSDTPFPQKFGAAGQKAGAAWGPVMVAHLGGGG